MLAGFRRWLLAPSTPLSGERRLLAFADTTRKPYSKDSGIAPEADAIAAMEEAKKKEQDETIEKTSQKTADKVAEAMSKDGKPKEQEAGDAGAGGDSNDVQEAPKLSATEVLRTVEGSIAKIEETQKRFASCDKHAKNMLGEHYKRWQKDDLFLSTQHVQLLQMKGTLEALQRWENQKLTPSEMLDAIAGSAKFANGGDNTAWGDTIRGTRETVDKELKQDTPLGKMALDVLRGDTLPKANESDRIAAQAEAKRITELVDKEIDLNACLLQPMDEYAKRINEALEKADSAKILEEVEKAAGAHEMSQTGKDKGGSKFQMNNIRGSLENILGVRLKSAMEMWNGLKSIWEAYKESWEQKGRLESAEFAHSISKALLKKLPYGEDVDQILQKNNESKNDEVKEAFISFLKSKNISFRAIFEDGLLRQNRHDPNRSRAILEYCAAKGWLYRFYEEEGKDALDRKLFGEYRLGDMVPKDWSKDDTENYYYDLVTKNEKGEEEETDATYARVRKRDNVPAFVKNIEIELGNLNFWAVIGIVKRAMERGLQAEVCPWLTTTIYTWMEEHAGERRYMPQTFLDQLGNLGLYRTNRWIGFPKAERNLMNGWILSTSVNLDEAGAAGKAIKRVREEILQKSKRSFKTEDDIKLLKRLIGRVMTGETLDSDTPDLELPKGVSISIFSDRYKEARDSYADADGDPTVPGIKDEDPDYFTQVTDNILMGETSLQALMTGDGRGGFTHLEKFSSYFGGVLVLYRNFKQRGMRSEAENLRKELGRKLTAVMRTSVLNDSRTDQVHEIKTKVKGKYQELAMYTLVREGFLDIGVLVRCVYDGGGGKTWTRRTLEQLDRGLVWELDEIMKQKSGAAKEQAFSNHMKKWYAVSGFPDTEPWGREKLGTAKKKGEGAAEDAMAMAA